MGPFTFLSTSACHIFFAYSYKRLKPIGTFFLSLSHTNHLLAIQLRVTTKLKSRTTPTKSVELLLSSVINKYSFLFSLSVPTHISIDRTPFLRLNGTPFSNHTTLKNHPRHSTSYDQVHYKNCYWFEQNLHVYFSTSRGCLSDTQDINLYITIA